MKSREPVLPAIRKSGLLRRGERMLCALSGGADSVCLTHALCALREELGLTVAAVHFSHGLRPEAAERERALCQNLCQRLGIELFCGEGDTRALAGEKSLSLEEAARRLRYAFFEEQARRWQADSVATGHNLEDNAETLLLNLVRGSGRAGLEGIPPRRGLYVRPLLQVSREEILSYVRENRLAWATDPTNLGEENARSLLRSRVFPLLERINPQAARHMAETANELRAGGRETAALAEELIRSVRREGKEIVLPAGRLLSLPEEAAVRALQALQRELGGKMLTRRQVEAVFALCAGSSPSASANLAGSRAARRYEELVLTAEEAAPPPAPVVLQAEGEVRFGRWMVAVGPGAFPVTIRSRRQGDILLTPSGQRTLKKWMIDHKIPKDFRDTIPIVCHNNKILAVGDLWTAGGPENALRVKCRRIKP